MSYYNDWLLIRELLLTAVFGLFVVFAVLAGVWQNRSAKRRPGGMTDQDASQVVPTMVRNGYGRAVEYKGVSPEARPAARVARHAA
jgi:hypothetical protein